MWLLSSIIIKSGNRNTPWSAKIPLLTSLSHWFISFKIWMKSSKNLYFTRQSYFSWNPFSFLCWFPSTSKYIEVGILYSLDYRYISLSYRRGIIGWDQFWRGIFFPSFFPVFLNYCEFFSNCTFFSSRQFIKSRILLWVQGWFWDNNFGN